MAMTRRQIKNDIRNLLADNNASYLNQTQTLLDGVEWFDTLLNDAIEEAIRKTCIVTGCTRVVADLGAPSATPPVGVFSSPSDFLSLNRVLYGAASATEDQMSVLDETSVGFELLKKKNYRLPGTGTFDTAPKRFAWYHGNAIVVFPAIATYGANTHVFMDYIQKPAAMTNDDATPDARVQGEQHQYLKYAAAAWLLMNDHTQADLAKAQLFTQMYQDLVKVR